jgi:hypothetical protein
MPAKTEKGRRFLADELTVLGLLTGVLWALLAVAWTRRSGLAQLLWLCDLTTLGTAIGLLTRSRLILTAQFVAMLIYHLAWQADMLSYTVLGKMPLGSTSYMFSGELTSYEKALSFLQHTFILPVCIWSLLRLGAARRGWLVQAAQTAVVIMLTWLFTKPEENINWVFGAGFANLSPASMTPGWYYALMATLPAVFYFPANLLALRVASAPRFTIIPIRRRVVFSFGSFVLAGLVAVLAGRALEPDAALPPGLLDLPARSVSPLENVQRLDRAPRLLTASYGLPGRESEVSLREWKGYLPRARTPDGQFGPLLLRDAATAMSGSEPPRTPQEMVLRGTRGRKGTVVCAIVGGDSFYGQTPCDTETALDRFELHCHLGAEGLAEFVSNGAAHTPVPDNQVVARSGIQSVYAIIAVEFDRHKRISRTPAYIFLRAGVYSPDDVVWSMTDGGLTARLR